MTSTEVFAELDRLIGQAISGERPGLALALAARMAALAAAMTTTGGDGDDANAERWITAQEAAKIARIEVRTLYDWAANKPWASRKTRRCLRIEEGGFRRWLSGRNR